MTIRPSLHPRCSQQSNDAKRRHRRSCNRPRLSPGDPNPIKKGRCQHTLTTPPRRETTPTGAVVVSSDRRRAGFSSKPSHISHPYHRIWPHSRCRGAPPQLQHLAVMIKPSWNTDPSHGQEHADHHPTPTRSKKTTPDQHHQDPQAPQARAGLDAPGSQPLPRFRPRDSRGTPAHLHHGAPCRESLAQDPRTPDLVRAPPTPQRRRLPRPRRRPQEAHRAPWPPQRLPTAAPSHRTSWSRSAATRVSQRQLPTPTPARREDASLCLLTMLRPSSRSPPCAAAPETTTARPIDETPPREEIPSGRALARRL